MLAVTLYIRDNCSQCDHALEDLRSLQDEVPHKLYVVNVDSSADLKKRWGESVPAIRTGPYKLSAPFTRQQILVTLSAARDVDTQQETNIQYQRQQKQRYDWTLADKINYWIGHHFMTALNVFLFLFIGLPFLAPVLMETGHPGLARPIYSFYSVLCHQLAYRSFFLFGEQPVYPREAANLDQYISFEEITGHTADTSLADVRYASRLTGEGVEGMGYKIAYCQRDIAIYLSMLLFGILFQITGRKLKALPWYWWVLIGIFPIGLDGGSQLLSQMFNMPFFHYRESIPLLRVITGTLFGFTTAWFGFPLMQETADDARVNSETKMSMIKNKDKYS